MLGVELSIKTLAIGHSATSFRLERFRVLSIFINNLLKPNNGHPEGWPLLSCLRKAPYCSLFSLFSLFRRLMRSPRVVVELETGALWLSFL